MKQNKYDEPEFFAKYSKMPRSLEGLSQALEWQSFRALLPDLREKRLLDLGCGFGWHCRYAREQQAGRVVGVDISHKMLSRAKAATVDSGIEYRRLAVEDADFAVAEFDVVLSSLALHYVECFDRICQKVHRWLAVDGAFVFSVEHPIFTANAVQQWCCGPNGERLHWPVDQYQQEGPRHTDWLTRDVIKYHRTVSTYINTLIDAGFRISGLVEPGPTAEMAQDLPELQDERRRPMFLLIAAIKASGSEGA